MAKKAAAQKNKDAIDNLAVLLRRKKDLENTANSRTEYIERSSVFGINKIDISRFSLDDKKDMDMAIGIIVKDVKRNLNLRMARVRPPELWEPQIDGILDDDRSFSVIIRIAHAPRFSYAMQENAFSTWKSLMDEYKEPNLIPTETELANIHTDLIFFANVGLMFSGSFDENGNAGFYAKYEGLKRLR